MQNLANYTDSFTINHTVIASVVNNEDTLKRGRVQVRIVGITHDDVLDVDCPWAEQKTLMFASDSDIPGVTSVPEVGTYVYIEFLYGNPSFPIITGVVRGAGDSSPLHLVEELTQTIDQTRKDNIIGPELPPLNSSSVYPDNHVIQTKKKNIIELDDTDGNERITISHDLGSHVEIRPDGTIQIKSVKDLYCIIKDNIEEYIEKNFRGLTKGLFELEANGNIKLTGDVKIIGNLEVTEKVSAGDSVTSASEVADSQGNISSLREAFDTHEHIYNPGSGAPTNTSSHPTDPISRESDFGWKGNRI